MDFISTMKYFLFQAGESLTIEVPVGSVEDTLTVIISSFIATVIGTVAILVSLRHASDQRYNNSKDNKDT